MRRSEFLKLLYKVLKLLVRREVEMILRCAEFFGVRRINIRRSDKKFETSKKAQLNAK